MTYSITGPIEDGLRLIEEGLIHPLNYEGHSILLNTANSTSDNILDFYTTLYNCTHRHVARPTAQPRITSYSRRNRFFDILQEMNLEEDEITSQLQTSQNPYEDLEDLSREVFSDPDNYVKPHSSREVGVAFYADIPLSVVSVSETNSDRLEIHIKSTVEISSLPLGFRLISRTDDNTPYIRSFYDASSIEALLSQEGTIFKLPLPGPSVSRRLFVLFGTTTLHSIEFGGLSPETIISNTLDPNLVFLRQCLLLEDVPVIKNRSNRRTRIQEDFEFGTMWLLSLLGFSCLPVGAYDPLKEDAPDIVAFSRDGATCLLVECTLRDPDNRNKLAKLLERRGIVEDALGQSSVRSMLVTAIGRKAVMRQIQGETKQQNVLLVTKDELEQCLGRIQEGVQSFGTALACHTIA